MLLGVGLLAAPAAAALTSQSISFAALAARTFGAAPFTISATASSGLAVGFASLTAPICTVAGKTVTIVAAGTCTIRASQAGNATYAAAPNVDQSFIVAKAAQTITFAAPTGKTFGAAPFALSATASSGLAVAFASTTTTVCTVSAATVTLKTAGTCTIQATQAGNANYNAAAALARSFTVAKAAQTLSFGALSGKTYGAAPFAVAATASSGLAVAFASTTTTICTVSGSTVTIKAAGGCTIQASQAGNANYGAATPVAQSFAIAKAAQTVAFGALSNRTYGASPFAISASASSGLAVSFASLTPSVCTVVNVAVTLLATGTCTIQAAQPGNGNYTAAASVSRSFDVAASTQTISLVSPGNQLLDVGGIALAATASSGLPVGLTSLTPTVCTIDAGVVYFLVPGLCTVRATQPGNAAYAAAPDVTRSFVVIAAPSLLPPATFATGTYPDSIALGDFNGDGKIDVAVANAFSGNVSILLGDGAGGFAPGTAVSFGGEPIAVVAGDFNGDGKLDLVAADLYYNRVFLLTGKGDGTFDVGLPVSVGLAPIALAVADLNRDNRLDLIVANGSVGNTTGRSITVLLGNGAGGFGGPIAYATAPSPYAIVTADFNRDGAIDLAVAGAGSNSVSVLLGRGDGTFAPAVDYAAGYFPDGLAAADLDGDGKLDLAVVNDYSNDVSILLGRGDGTFGAATSFAAGSGPASVAIADLNGDGIADLAIANRFDNTVALLLGNGDGTYQTALTHPVPPQPEVVVAADLNRDSRIDLILTSAAANEITVLLQSSGVVPKIVVVSSGSPQSATAGSAYALPLVARVADDGGRPLAGVAVTFAAPATGASVTFAGGAGTVLVTTDSGGLAASPALTANSIAGAFVVTASVGSASVGFALTNTGGAPQTIAFGALSGKVYGAAPFTLAASASSGLPVSFSSLTPPVCTVSGTTLTIVAVGTCAVRAGQPGNGAYAAAPSVDQSFTVAQAGQTIAFGVIAGQPLGGAALSLAATASSGLPVAFASLTPGVCTIVGSQASIVAAGVCTIRASQSGNANYLAAASVDQSFAVTAGGQTITFPAPSSQTFGSGALIVSATASSGLPVTISSLSPGVCVVNFNAVALVAAGTCTLRAAQPGNASFAAAPNVDRSFAVARASQTILFTPPGNRPITAEPELLWATASSGLPVGFASLTPAVCVISADLASMLTTGVCTVRASQPGNANYLAAASVDKSFTIGGVTQTFISFDKPGPQYTSTIPFALAASSPSGLPITFATLTPAICSVTGNAATAVAQGTCTIRASLAGNAIFAPASVDQSFLVFATTNIFAPPTPPAPLPSPPFIAYSTYLGGFGADKTFDIIVGPDGAAYVGGSVASSNFPGLSSSVFTNAGLDLLFVARINPAGGKLDFTTVTGGRAPDITQTGLLTFVGGFQNGAAAFLGGGQVEAMAIDAAGNVFVASYADSTDYPVRGGTYVRGGPKKIFKITAAGSVQAISSAIDPAVMTIRALAVDAAGAIYFTGVAGPGLATTPGAILAAMPTGPFTQASAPYLIKLAPGGATTVFATYLSAAGRRSGTPDFYDQSKMDAATTAYAIAVDAAGNSYLAGQAQPDQFPVTAGSPDTADTAHRDTFVAKVNSTGTVLAFVARLGGVDAERATGIALSPDGSIVVGGKTATFPFRGSGLSFQSVVYFRSATSYVDRETGFVAKLAADGSKWLWVGTLGTDGGNLANGALDTSDAQPVKVAVDAGGFVYAAGTGSRYRDLISDVTATPLANGLGGIESSGAVVVKISPDGSKILYMGALGGFGAVATGLAVDNLGNAYVCGYGSSMATVDAPLAAPMFESDWTSAFVAKLNDQSAPVTLSIDRNPGIAGQTLSLTAMVADVRDSGNVEFVDRSQVLGLVPISGGRASLAVALSVGIHRLRATYHGAGPYDRLSSLEIIESIDQAPAP